MELQFDLEPTGFDILLHKEDKKEILANKQHTCPVCKKGKLFVTKELPRIRSPAGHLPTIFRALLD